MDNSEEADVSKASEPSIVPSFSQDKWFGNPKVWDIADALFKAHQEYVSMISREIKPLSFDLGTFPPRSKHSKDEKTIPKMGIYEKEKGDKKVVKEEEDREDDEEEEEKNDGDGDEEVESGVEEESSEEDDNKKDAEEDEEEEEKGESEAEDEHEHEEDANMKKK